MALYQSKEKLRKVNSKISEALNSRRRERRSDAKALKDCASLTVSVSLFVSYSSSVEIDTIGTNETIRIVSASIFITSITSTSCTDKEFQFFNFEYFIATYIKYITKGLDQMHNCISRVFTLKYYKIHKYNLNTVQSRIGQKTHKCH